MKELLTYAVMLASIIVAYIPTIRDKADRIIEIAKSERQCFCSKTTTVLSEWAYQTL